MTKPLITVLPDISDDLLLLLISPLFLDELTGWRKWQCPVENCTHSLQPACLLTEDLALGVAPTDTTANIAAECQPNWLGPLYFPWLSYLNVLLLTPVLCHLRGPQNTCCPAPLSPTLTPALSFSLCFFLSGLLIHTVVCSHRTWYCRHVMHNERLDDLSFFTAVFPVVLLLVLYSPSAVAAPVFCFPLPKWDSLDLNVVL